MFGKKFRKGPGRPGPAPNWQYGTLTHPYNRPTPSAALPNVAQGFDSERPNNPLREGTPLSHADPAPAPTAADDVGPLLLDLPAVARQLTVSERTVRRLIEKGHLPAVHVRHSIRVRATDLDEYVRKLT